MSIFSRWNKPKTPSQSSSSTPPSASAVADPPPPADVNRSTASTTLFTPGAPDVESEIFAIGSTFLDIARSKQAGVFSSQFWSDKLMDWAMKDEAFKIQFFRFVDTFPALKTPEQIHDHLVDYMSQPGVTPPPGMELMTKAGGIAKGLFSSQMTKQITGMAKKFIAGENAEAAAPVLKDLWKHGMCFSVDLLGEACNSERVANLYQERYLDLVNNLPGLVAGFPANSRLESDHLGPIPRVNVSIKITSLDAGIDPVDHDASIDRLLDRLGPLLVAAGKNNVHINFDIEQYEFKDLTLDLFERCCEKHDFPAGLALQAYLRSGIDDAKRVIHWAKRAGRQITVRLVKGAYWDYETIHAEQEGWPVPVWSRKQDSDACFEEMAKTFIENMPRTPGEGGVKLALGSHNARSIAHSIATIRKNNFPDHALELQMLHGMGDPLKAAAIEMDLRLREYVPIGELLVGMAYFVRRLLENTSNESWLRASFAEGSSVDLLLADPASLKPEEPDHGIALIEDEAERHTLSPGVAEISNGKRFFNEPRRDFGESEARESFAAAVDQVGSETDSPGISDFSQSLQGAFSAYREWRTQPVLDRAKMLSSCAARLRSRRDTLAASLVHEAGYTWREADAEVCDAIDLFEFHARSAIQFFDENRLGRFVGELNEHAHAAFGVVEAHLPIWNPMVAAAAGASAAIVTGNACLLSPSPSARSAADRIRQAFIESGAPSDLLAVVESPENPVDVKPGIDFAICLRPDLVDHDTAVQLGTIESPTRNATIIDASADMNEAVAAVRTGAFGRSGVSPFACQFAVVIDTAYDSFLERLLETTDEMAIGDPRLPSTDMGLAADEHVVRDTAARLRVSLGQGSIAHPNADARVKLNERQIVPHVVVDAPLEALSTMTPPLAPVVFVVRVDSFDEALKMVHAICGPSSFAGIYSRKPSNIERTRHDMRTGFVAINAPFHVPRVARQPIAASGRGSAAFLEHFVRQRTVSENTMRRGFAPEL